MGFPWNPLSSFIPAVKLSLPLSFLSIPVNYRCSFSLFILVSRSWQFIHLYKGFQQRPPVPTTTSPSDIATSSRMTSSVTQQSPPRYTDLPSLAARVQEGTMTCFGNAAIVVRVNLNHLSTSTQSSIISVISPGHDISADDSNAQGRLVSIKRYPSPVPSCHKLPLDYQLRGNNTQLYRDDNSPHTLYENRLYAFSEPPQWPPGHWTIS